MKFVSKNSNLMVVLRPGILGNHLSGTATINGIYVKFSQGMADVKEEKFIDMMKLHPAFGSDFIAVETPEEDPFAYLRKEVEPAHVITEINYGHAEKSVGSKKNTQLSPEIKKMLQDEAVRMAKEMLPGMMKEMMKEMQSESLTKKEEETESNAIIVEEVTPKVTAPKKGAKDNKATPTE